MYNNGDAYSLTEGAIMSLRNEMVYTNLIAIASNEKLRSHLTEEVNNSLDDIVAAYTEANLKRIIFNNNQPDAAIREEYSKLGNGISSRISR